MRQASPAAAAEAAKEGEPALVSKGAGPEVAEAEKNFPKTKAGGRVESVESFSNAEAGSETAVPASWSLAKVSTACLPTNIKNFPSGAELDRNCLITGAKL